MTISEYLKTQTKTLHDQTEKKFQSHQIFEKTFSLEQYKKLLLGNYFLIKNMEDQVFSTFSNKLSQELNLNERRKLSAIEKDIQNLQLAQKTSENSIKVKNQEEAFGMLYVMEGSTLGGNVIAKQLSRNSEFQNVSYHYFGIYGEETGAKWNNFKSILDREISEDQFEQVLNAAKKAYELLLNF